MLLKVSEVRKP